MTRIEDELPQRLADLADGLAAGARPSPGAVRARHAHTRRNSRVLAGTVATVVAVVVAVPLARTALGPEEVAVEPPATTTAPGTTAPGTTATESAAPTAPSTQATPTDAAWQDRLTEAAELAAQLGGPVAPRAPSPFDTCPAIAEDLSARLGVEIVPDGGEGGSIDPYSGLCQWATPETAAESADPPTRYGMTVRFMPDVRVEDLRGRYFLCDQGGPCPTVDAPVADPQGFLVSDLESGFQSLDLVVPDAGGAGTWIVDAYRGTEYPGPSLLQALDATAAALDAVYGTP